MNKRSRLTCKRMVLFAILCATLLAGVAPPASGADWGELQLSLEDARKLAIEGNNSHALARLDFEAAEIQLDVARAKGLVRPSVVAAKRAENAKKNAARALVA